MNHYEDIEFLRHEREKRRTLKRTLFFVCAIALVVTGFIVFSGGSNATQDVIIAKKQSFVAHIREFVFSGNRTVKGFKDDRINILLLGVGGAGHDGPQLSDTIILLSIKPSTKQIAMLSIPRDIAVEIPGYGVKKINNANAFGEEKGRGEGGILAARVATEMTGQPIHYFVRIDFQAFEEIIDKIGGLTIDVERSFIDTRYPDINDTYQTVQFDAGREHMNGQRALMYARSRHGSNGEDSDFARARRQQNILIALKKTLVTDEQLKNPSVAVGITQSLLSHTTSNINPLAFISLLGEAPDLMKQPVTHHVLSSDPHTGLLNEVNNAYGYYLVPRAGDFDEIAYFVAHIFETQTQGAPKNITPKKPITRAPESAVVILNGTWEIGLAGKIRSLLEENGVPVNRVGNTEDRTVEKTVIYTLNTTTSTGRTLTRITPLLNGVITAIKPPFDVASYIDIVIVLGKDLTSYAGNTTTQP